MNNKYILFLFLIGSIIIFFLHQGVIDPDIMESRNFLSAKEMVDFNHWLVPTKNLQPRLEKPPLPTWITACFYYLFGSGTFALRMPASIMLLILLLFCIKVINQFSRISSFNKNAVTLLTIAITSSSFYIFFQGRTNSWDIYCHAFCLISIFFLNKSWIEHRGNSYINHILAGFFLGCSFMSKGPISMYTILLPFLIAYITIFKIRTSNTKNIVITSLIALIVGGYWYIHVYLQHPELFSHVTNKEVSNWHSYHLKPWYHYWSFFVQSGIWTVLSLLGILGAIKDTIWKNKTYRFYLIWTLSSLILLSIIPEKKERYLFPTLIPLASLTAIYIEDLSRRWKNRIDIKTWDTILLTINNIAVSVILAVGTILFVVVRAYYGKETSGISYTTAILLGIPLSCLLYLFIKSWKNRELKRICFLMFGTVVYLFLAILPLNIHGIIYSDQYNSPQQLTNNSKYNQSSCYALNNDDIIRDEFLWQLGKTVCFVTPNKLDSLLNKENSIILITNHDIDTLIPEAQNNNKSFEKILSSDITRRGHYNNLLVNKIYLVSKK